MGDARFVRSMMKHVCYHAGGILIVLLVSMGCISTHAAPPAQWNSRGPGGGGALFAPSFSPYNAGELFMACDMSEVFHSTNFGASWAVLDFRQIQGGRQAVAQFTSNPQVLYAVDFTGDLMTPTRSGDGGSPWQQLPGDPTGGGAYSLLADPNATNRVLVSDYATLYFSADGGNSFSPKFTNAPSGAGCYVAGVFFDGANIYVGTGFGLLVSTNGGGTFALSSVGGIAASQSMVSFAGAKQGGTTRFFCVTLNSADVFPGLFIEGDYASYQGVYSLDWGQANWTLRTTGITAGEQPVFMAMAQNTISPCCLAVQQS